jgi:hypothetical protein
LVRSVSLKFQFSTNVLSAIQCLKPAFYSKFVSTQNVPVKPKNSIIHFIGLFDSINYLDWIPKSHLYTHTHTHAHINSIYIIYLKIPYSHTICIPDGIYLFKQPFCKTTKVMPKSMINIPFKRYIYLKPGKL